MDPRFEDETTTQKKEGKFETRVDVQTWDKSMIHEDNYNLFLITIFSFKNAQQRLSKKMKMNSRMKDILNHRANKELGSAYCCDLSKIQQ